jgi:hypothetical protein
MPKTRIGKIDYKVLVQQYIAAHQFGGRGVGAT